MIQNLRQRQRTQMPLYCASGSKHPAPRPSPASSFGLLYGASLVLRAALDPR